MEFAIQRSKDVGQIDSNVGVKLDIPIELLWLRRRGQPANGLPVGGKSDLQRPRGAQRNSLATDNVSQNGVDGAVELVAASPLVWSFDDVSIPPADPRSSSPRERGSSPLLESICPLPAESLEMWTKMCLRLLNRKQLSAHGDRPLKIAIFFDG